MLSPFRRLARTALITAGDGQWWSRLPVRCSSPSAPTRRTGVLYLLVSFAPFAVVAPFIGPFIDRAPGGRRFIIQLTAVGRALLCDHDLPPRRPLLVRCRSVC
jgi:hypothetical protein